MSGEDEGSRGERAYLSVLVWPESAGEDERVEMLVRSAGLDPYNARLAVRRGAPRVVSLVDGAIAGEVVAALEACGVSAAAPTRAQMESLPGAVRGMRAGRSRANPSRIAVRLRDEAVAEFDPTDVTAVVRATVATTTTTADSLSGPSAGMMTASVMAGGMVGAAMASAAFSGERRSSDTRAAHLVEIQLADGRRYRFDSRTAPASKADRLLGPGERMDRLALALAEACPKATIDHRFRSFGCPPDVLRTASTVTGSRVVTTRDEAPLFEFYSAWTLLVGRGAAS